MDGSSIGPTWTPEQLHARYASRIARHVRAVLGQDDEREDLVQDVLLNVFRHIDSLRDPACIDQWVAQITRTEIRHLFRRRRARRYDSWESLPEQLGPSFQLNHDARDLALRVLGVMARLPPSDRQLLTTYWFDHTSVPSMAAHFGCSVITVRRRLGRAKTRFAKLSLRDPALASWIESSGSWLLGPSAEASS